MSYDIPSRYVLLPIRPRSGLGKGVTSRFLLDHLDEVTMF